MATIRHALPGDASAIAALWNPIIRHTIVTFNAVEKPEAEVAAIIADRRDGFFVAEEAGVVGFATFAPFRPGPGYAHTLEHTVILGPAAQGRGIGARLIATLCDAGRRQGAHVLVAAISAANHQGLAFHAAVGFQEVARMPEVGYKFGRWHDLVLMQRRL